MLQREIARTFESQLGRAGEWIGSDILARSMMATCNAYLQDAGYMPVSEAISPEVMIVGVVKKGVMQKPFPAPSLVKAMYDPLVGSNHESSFNELCQNYKVRPFHAHSFWWGLVLPDESVAAHRYHLVLNTYGELDGLNQARRRTVADQLVHVLENVRACVVIESPDSVFEARSRQTLASHERGIDFSVPW